LHPIASGVAAGAVGNQKVINICPDEIGALAASFYKVDGLVTHVNSEDVKKVFFEAGLDDKFIKILGHPLDPAVFSARGQIFQRVQNDLKSKRLIIGLYIGWFGPKTQKRGLLSVVRELAPLVRQNRVTLKILCGRHKDFEKKLDCLCRRIGIENKIEIQRSEKPEDMVNVGHKWILEDINIIFSRPSELVFYSLATGIPHILFSAFGPQEYDMLAFLKKCAPVKKHENVKGQLENYLTDTNLLLETSIFLFNSNYNFRGAISIEKYLK